MNKKKKKKNEVKTFRISCDSNIQSYAVLPQKCFLRITNYSLLFVYWKTMSIHYFLPMTTRS